MTGTWQESKWQSMDTAPKNGRAILVWDGVIIRIAEWRNAMMICQDKEPIFDWCIPFSDVSGIGARYIIPIAWTELPEHPTEYIFPNSYRMYCHSCGRNYYTIYKSVMKRCIYCKSKKTQRVK